MKPIIIISFLVWNTSAFAITKSDSIETIDTCNCSLIKEGLTTYIGVIFYEGRTSEVSLKVIFKEPVEIPIDLGHPPSCFEILKKARIKKSTVAIG